MRDANAMFASAVDISADGQSSILDVGPSSAGGEWVQFATIGAVTGTTPTLTVKVQASASATFASGVRDIGSFSQFTAQGQRDEILVQHEERYLRLDYDVGGTTPVFNDCDGAVVSGPNSDATV